MDITIEPIGNRLAVVTPRNAEFIAKIKDLGGRWDRGRGAWMVDARDEKRVRDLCIETFGTDGTPGETVDVQIAVADFRPELRDQDGPQKLEVLGRVVATRPGRDARVKLGDGVIVTEGGFPEHGGSVKNPRLDADAGTVLEIRDVPARHPGLQDERVRVVRAEQPAEQPAEQGEADDVDALLAEREELIARLAEIDAALPQPEGTTASTREAAQILGVSVRTVQRWAATGRVEAAKDAAGRWVITVTVTA